MVALWTNCKAEMSKEYVYKIVGQKAKCKFQAFQAVLRLLQSKMNAGSISIFLEHSHQAKVRGHCMITQSS
jgi:hypothetical protein